MAVKYLSPLSKDLHFYSQIVKTGVLFSLSVNLTLNKLKYSPPDDVGKVSLGSIYSYLLTNDSLPLNQIGICHVLIKVHALSKTTLFINWVFVETIIYS